ncbi:MAG: alpha/beta hydrolase [Bryobacteraceae bacterium]
MLRSLLTLFLAASLFAETALLEGRKVHYSTYGNGKQAIVLIHGWTCDESVWASAVPDLAKQYRVLTVDLPGHGQSDAVPGNTMEAYADAVGAAIQHANIKRAILAGHSMGGPVILAFARRFPEQTTALVGVDAVFLDAATAEKMKDPAKRFEGPGGLTAREQMIRSMFSAATTNEMQEHILRMMLATPESVAVGAMQSMWAPAFWRDDAIDLPMLEIAAATNTYMTLESLKRRFPKAELQRIEGTGHFLMMERPAEFDRILLDWLAAQH